MEHGPATWQNGQGCKTLLHKLISLRLTKSGLHESLHAWLHRSSQPAMPVHACYHVQACQPIQSKTWDCQMGFGCSFWKRAIVLNILRYYSCAILSKLHSNPCDYLHILHKRYSEHSLYHKYRRIYMHSIRGTHSREATSGMGKTNCVLRLRTNPQWVHKACLPPINETNKWDQSSHRISQQPSLTWRYYICRTRGYGFYFKLHLIWVTIKVFTLHWPDKHYPDLQLWGLV